MFYSTTTVHPRERLSYWREVAARGYVQHETLPADRASFAGTVQISSLPTIGIAAFDAAAHHVQRSAKNAAHEESGDLLLSAVTSGEVVVSQDGRDCVIENRGLYLVDPVRPFELVLRKRSRHVIAKVPRRMIDARMGHTSDLTGRNIPISSGVGMMAFGLMGLLPDQAEQLDDISGVTVSEHLLDLAALVLAGVRPKRSAALSSPRSVALLRLKATVERLLIEPGLKPERVAAEAGISVRYANALLADEDTSIERYITDRRLSRARAALEDQNQNGRSIGEIAYNWGFSDLSHFGRRFKARYGLTPSDYRNRAALKQIE